MSSNDLAGLMREFRSMEEIKNEPDYKPKNPLHEKNYKQIFGHYHFPEGSDVECCVRKGNGNLCNHLHRKGWVARLKNDSVTILGGDCANNKFLSNSVLARDLRRANNALIASVKRKRLNELLQNRQNLIDELQAFGDILTESSGVLASYRIKFGMAVWDRLAKMSRMRSGDVTVIGYVPAKYKGNELVAIKFEMEIVVGTIRGVRICNDAEIANQLRHITDFARSTKPSSNLIAAIPAKELREIAATLGNQPALVARIRDMIALIPLFVSNDFTCLGFLPSPVDQRQIVCAALELSGRAHTREAAEKWMAKRERELLSTFKVERIRIP